MFGIADRNRSLTHSVILDIAHSVCGPKFTEFWENAVVYKTLSYRRETALQGALVWPKVEN